mgnify:CR=1 FL=1
MTPVVLLTDAFVANGSAAWKLPKLADYPAIVPPYVRPDMQGTWTPYQRDEKTGSRYWAIPGTEGFTHVLGGLEKDNKTGAISTDPENHDLMTRLRAEKIAKIEVPDVEVEGDKDDADLLIVGFGGTYGHLHAAMDELRAAGNKVALAHFKFINPLPKNTERSDETLQESSGGRAEHGTVCRIPAYESRWFRSLPVQSGKRSAFPGK